VPNPEATMDERESNRAFWNELADIHEKSTFYDVDSFMRGRNTLRPIELEELGDVRGKSLLHLQCHFGMDTLSWSRLGANVTGVDFSDHALALARRLATELGLQARFIQSDIYELPSALDEQFDIVITSYGVLCWLRDLNAWANVINRFLKPGGTFLIVEGHPLADLLDDNCPQDNLRMTYQYFDKSMLTFHDKHSYADSTIEVQQPVHYEWMHTLQEIFGALLNAGLRIQAFHEYPFSMYQKFPWLSKSDDGWWRPTDESISIPMLFSLKATKDLQR
jgi:ubiquinone/menaquinone biosynthesis C-methylase UbiE